MRNIQRIRSLATTPMTFTAANTYIGQVGELVSVFDDSDGTAVALRIHDGNTVGGLLYYQINSYVAPEDTGTSGVVSDNSGTSINDAVYSGWLNENVIDYSAYFDGSSYLERLFSNASEAFTFSAWIKIPGGTSDRPIFSSWNENDSNNRDVMHLQSKSSGYKFVYQSGSSGIYSIIESNTTFLDPSSWYHIIVSIDDADGAGGSETQINDVYINGKLEASHEGGRRYWSQINQARTHYLGARKDVSGIPNFVGYMANIQMIDGAALDASYFGETVEGNWIHRPYDGTSTVEGATPVSGLSGNDIYGTNGFHLNFANESNLGKDVSGNGNDWT